MRRWSRDEINKALRMHQDGHSNKVIADALNRTIGAVADQIRMINSPQRQAQVAARVRTYERKPGVIPRLAEYKSVRPSADILRERDARLALPLTISQAILGDPPPGRSALDRMRERAQ